MPIYMNQGGSSGGGGMLETLLWENESPSEAFGGQDVSLSDNLSNYDYIKIEFKRLKSASSADYTELRNIISWGDLEYSSFILGVFQSTSSSDITLYSRKVWVRNNGTSIKFGACYNASSNVSNNNIVPIKIYGVNIS